MKRRKAWGLPKRAVGDETRQDKTRQERGTHRTRARSLFQWPAVGKCDRGHVPNLGWTLECFRKAQATAARTKYKYNIRTYGVWKSLEPSEKQVGKTFRRTHVQSRKQNSQLLPEPRSSAFSSQLRPFTPAAGGRNTVVGGCAIPKPRSSIASCRLWLETAARRALSVVWSASIE